MSLKGCGSWFLGEWFRLLLITIVICILLVCASLLIPSGRLTGETLEALQLSSLESTGGGHHGQGLIKLVLGLFMRRVPDARFDVDFLGSVPLALQNWNAPAERLLAETEYPECSSLYRQYPKIGRITGEPATCFSTSVDATELAKTQFSSLYAPEKLTDRAAWHCEENVFEQSHPEFNAGGITTLPYICTNREALLVVETDKQGISLINFVKGDLLPYTIIDILPGSNITRAFSVGTYFNNVYTRGVSIVHFSELLAGPQDFLSVHLYFWDVMVFGALTGTKIETMLFNTTDWNVGTILLIVWSVLTGLLLFIDFIILHRKPTPKLPTPSAAPTRRRSISAALHQMHLSSPSAGKKFVLKLRRYGFWITELLVSAFAIMAHAVVLFAHTAAAPSMVEYREWSRALYDNSPLLDNWQEAHQSQIKERLKLFDYWYGRDNQSFFIAVAFIVLLLTIHALSTVPSSSHLSVLRKTLVHNATQLVHLLFVWIVLLCVASAVAWVLFDSLSFHTYGKSLQNTFFGIIGADVGAFTGSAGGLIFYIIVWSLSNFLLFNLFIGVITDGYNAQANTNMKPVWGAAVSRFSALAKSAKFALSTKVSTVEENSSHDQEEEEKAAARSSSYKPSPAPSRSASDTALFEQDAEFTEKGPGGVNETPDGTPKNSVQCVELPNTPPRQLADVQRLHDVE